MVLMYYNTEEPSAFEETIAMSVSAICSIAAQALQNLEQDGCKRHH